MIRLVSALLLGTASFVAAVPVHGIHGKRIATSLDQASFEEAQQRDDTATRAFFSIPIKVRRARTIV